MKIKLENVNYIYNEGTANEKKAVSEVSFETADSEFIALVGGTGSGKSTLVQMLNGLNRPTSGNITYDGICPGDDKKALREIRCRVGLVFQYPEYQLFDETVLKDVAFGPKNKGLKEQDALLKAHKALEDVGLPEELYSKSPFELSGGEKRRVAIAGVMAMEPEVLILDEPTAGLDPAGKTEILELLRRYRTEHRVTVIMVSHNMDEVAEYADRVIAMKEGRIILDDKTHEAFRHKEILAQTGLSLPEAAAFAESLGIEDAITVDEAAGQIIGRLGKQ